MTRLGIITNNILTFINKREYATAIIIVAINLLFRVINLTENNLWFDEFFSLYWSQFQSVKEVIHVSDWDVVPPGFNVIVHYWTKLFGISEFSIRFLSCFAMSLASGIVFILSKRAFNTRTAIIASIIFLVNTNLFYYSQESRSYACQMFLAALSSLLFICLMRKPNLVYAILLGAINYCLFYIHFSTMFLFFWQFVFAAFYFRNHLLNWYFISCCFFLIFLSPFIPRVIQLVQTNGQNFWLAKPTIQDLITYIEEYFNNSYIGILIALLCLVGLFLYFKNYKKREVNSTPELIYFFLTGVGFVAIAYIESTLKAPLFLKRYVLVSNIGVIIFVSYLISIVGSNRKVFATIIAVVVVSGLLTISYTTYKGWNYKRQMAIVKCLKNEETAIITDNELAFYYYNPDYFTHIYDLQQTISKENIFAVYDTTMFNSIDFSKFKRVVVCNTWKVSNDNIKSVVLKKFPKTVDILFENDNCKTHVYSK